MPRKRVFDLDPDLSRDPLHMRLVQAGGDVIAVFPTEHAVKKHREHIHRLLRDLSEVASEDWEAVVSVAEHEQTIVSTSLDNVSRGRLLRRILNHFAHQPASLWRARGRLGVPVALPLPPDPPDHVISNFIARVRLHAQNVLD